MGVAGERTAERDCESMFAVFALSPVFDLVFHAILVAQDEALCAMLLLINRAAGLGPGIVEHVFTAARLRDFASRDLPRIHIKGRDTIISLVTRLLQGPRILMRRVFAASSGSARGTIVNCAVNSMCPQTWITENSSEWSKAARESLSVEVGLLECLVDEVVAVILQPTAAPPEAELGVSSDNEDGYVNMIAWTPDLNRIQSVIAYRLVWAAIWSYPKAGNICDEGSAASSESWLPTVTTNSKSTHTPAPQLFGVDGDSVARLLRVLRRLISGAENDATRELRLRSLAVPTNRFVKFYSENKMLCKVFDLLLVSDCTLGGDDDNPVMRELLQMHSAPECSELFSSDDRLHRIKLIKAGNRDWRRGVEDVARFAHGFAGGWKAAFDAFIACDLQEHGFPQRMISSESRIGEGLEPKPISLVLSRPAPAPVFVYGAPSLSAMPLLQRRARLLLSLRVDEFPKTPYETALKVRFGESDPNRYYLNTFGIVVKMDSFYDKLNGQFNSHVAHFHLASDVIN